MKLGHGFKIFAYGNTLPDLVGSDDHIGEFGLVFGGELYLYNWSSDTSGVGNNVNWTFINDITDEIIC